MNIAHIKKILEGPAYPLRVGIFVAPIAAALLYGIVGLANIGDAFSYSTGFSSLSFMARGGGVVGGAAFAISTHALVRALFAKSVRSRYGAALLCGLTAVVAGYLLYIISSIYRH
jgi:hypothetical protein